MAGTAESITRLATATAATALAVLAVLSLLLAAVARWRGRRAAARGFRHAAAHPARPQVCVLVLGDIGRSPRMEFHSLSLAEAGCEVQVVAYAASPAMAQFAGNEHIHVRPIRPAPALPAGLPKAVFLLYAPVKVLLQSGQLMFQLLVGMPVPSHILVQNPPAIPTLPVAWLCARLLGVKLIVDWHNYGHTILALNLGERHPVVRLAHWIERFFGRRGDHHLCVTDAMRQDLQDNWRITAKSLHDRPPPMFRPINMEARLDVYRLLHVTFGKALPRPDTLSSASTLFTERIAGEVVLRRERPALLVSSTSWTADEDFGLLLGALQVLEDNWDPADKLPPLVVIITGKGPQKEMYEGRIAQMKFQHVCILTAWLTLEQYAHLLASADLGVCLHTSSSGLDLPMKVVDMFGCQLPVCAKGFSCLAELVQDGENGRVFDTSDELAVQIKTLLRGFPDSPDLAQMRTALASFRNNDWFSNWTRIAAPVFGIQGHPPPLPPPDAAQGRVRRKVVGEQ